MIVHLKLMQSFHYCISVSNFLYSFISYACQVLSRGHSFLRYEKKEEFQWVSKGLIWYVSIHGVWKRAEFGLFWNLVIIAVYHSFKLPRVKTFSAV